MAFDTAFLDEIRNRTPLASLIGRRHKLVRSGRNWKICCPFHGEKTPSFYVYDDHFHCFGCGAHGDAITFVMQSEGRSFPEAVEQLAGEAGLEVPKQDIQQQQRAQEAKSLTEVLDLVQASYRRRLYQAEGRRGLEYLRKRGLSDDTIERFGLGWSGDGRNLVDELRPYNVTADMLVRSGVLRSDEQGRPQGELFFNRVTFPIRDRRGRLVSFGGRTLGDGQPKYLNGPETALFSKRRMLYNVDYAREAVHRGEELIVVEGYMDVIALDQAGFHGGVAPLGTALGDEQFMLLWRMAASPILCLDGDAAGARAALRSCEVALPLLTPERRVRFCRLEAKDDPDSLIRRAGAAAMQHALDGATSLAEELFNLLVGGMSSPGPDERAALRERLVALSQLIPDRSLASEYRSTLLDMFFAQFRRRGGKASAPGQRALVSSAGQHVVPGGDQRLRLLTALVLRYPNILPDIEQAYSGLELPSDLEEMRAALFDWISQDDGALTHERCLQGLKRHGLERAARELLAQNGVRARQNQRPGTEGEDLVHEEIIERWWHFYGFLNFEAFEKAVTHDIEAAIRSAYAENSETGGTFPTKLLARMRILDALRRGEVPEAHD
ncbi:DNA primase [Neokomagataea thailandica]|uniref:DNA primase n=1 Tax=Neokomagataea tanensis NBRC 106556 TaxID=1223519 RepID=A0ABQ0QHD9_9PROT|nr:MULTISPECIES: DNA primase [Neokomagataea]GBR44887.1 DNA primase [Neokomagataea tanensis NBRC 106556]